MEAFLAQSKPQIGVIYGRRRIGKTQLIERVLRNRKKLWFDGIENQSKANQIESCLHQLRRQVPDQFREDNPKSWAEVFYLLYEIVRDRKERVVIVFDEFQWMANYRVEIVSELKLAWDRYFSKLKNVHFILCGSIASFMSEKVIRSRALYGRTNLMMDLRPFSLSETAMMLPRHGRDEILEASLLSGGVPQYLEFLGAESSVRLAMEKLAFTRNGWLAGEFERIFVSHFGRNADYERIVKALAKHPKGLFRKDLAAKAKVDLGGRLSAHLMDLETSGFIASHVPVDKPPDSRLIKYELTDAYLCFYFAFIKPKLKSILRQDEAGTLFQQILNTGKFHAWMGHAFERLCRSHGNRIADLLGFEGIDYECGPFFRRSTSKEAAFQIDLLFDRADKVLTLCEMKYQRKPVGKAQLKEIESRTESLRQFFPGRTVQPVLIATHGASKEVTASLSLSRIIDLDDLFG